MTFAEILNPSTTSVSRKEGVDFEGPLDGRIVLVLCRVGRERLTVNLISLRVGYVPTNGRTSD